MDVNRTTLGAAGAAVVASAVGFVVHVGSREWIQRWVTSQMGGRQVAPSWDVRYLAALTSLETGVALVILYAMLRPLLPGRSSAQRGAILAVLLLAVTGRLLRQPLMDAAIGNPASVVVVQNGSTWLVWGCMCVAAALVFDAASARRPPA